MAMKDAGSLDRPTINPRGATGRVAGLSALPQVASKSRASPSTNSVGCASRPLGGTRSRPWIAAMLRGDHLVRPQQARLRDRQPE